MAPGSAQQGVLDREPRQPKQELAVKKHRFEHSCAGNQKYVASLFVPTLGKSRCWEKK